MPTSRSAREAFDAISFRLAPTVYCHSALATWAGAPVATLGKDRSHWGRWRFL